MTHTYLLEIGLEEMPANVIVSAEAQLKANVEIFLNEQNLEYGAVKTYSTPRRLAVMVKELAEGQPDKSESVKGPAKRIALDEEGNWTKAAIGFTKGQGVGVDDITFKELKGEEYVYAEKFIEGKSAETILEDIISSVVSINFPVSMKWGTSRTRYIRPVHWIVSLLDFKVIPAEMFGVQSADKTYGHRFLGQEIVLEKAVDYEEKLEQEYVIPDRNKRKQLIKDQIREICSAQNWALPLYNLDLIEEVTDLVEYPTAFYGSFNKNFLDVPESVLETAMAGHQRYFPVRKNDASEEFLPYFIGVRNGNAEHLDEVVKGNEKVIVARLEDAKFFYEEDKKKSIEEFVEQLKQVNYQEKLGSLYDKQKRVGKITQILAEKLNVSDAVKKQLERVSEIYKFDLVTSVVGEFSNLQGVIGSIYAAEKGEDTAVAQAIEQQYMPSSANGSLPSTETGTILSLAEKMDTLQLFFAIGLIPSGSNDPFALRRSAQGVVRILKELNLSLPFRSMSLEIINQLDLSQEIKDGFKKHEKEYFAFIKDRINNQMKTAGVEIPHDIRQAVLHSKEQDMIKMFEKAELLNSKKDTPEYKLVEESLTRVSNLVKNKETFENINQELFETDSEKALYEAVVQTQQNFEAKEFDAGNQYQALTQLAPVISDFFEHNMVNADDETIRQNRLSLLSVIHNLAETFADFSQLMIQ